MSPPSRSTLGLLLLALLPAPAEATKPCGPDTFLSNPRRASAQWRASAAWVAVGVVVARKENKVPYPNCALEDRSACAQWDQSELTVKVERYDKGKGPLQLRLVASLCAPDPPAEAGGRYRFYGVAPSAYLMFEALPREAKGGRSGP